MDDQKRTKILAGGLVAVILVFVLRTRVDNWLRGPIRALQNEITAAERSAETLQADEIRLEVAKRNLNDWQDVSLPPDVDDAQRLYREWIQMLAEESGFSRIDVIPASKSSQKEFSTVAVEVRRAETDLQGLTKFLFLFDQANLMHRISAMTINCDSPRGNPRLQISLTAEGMSVAGTEDHQELLARTSLTTAMKSTDTELVAAQGDFFPVPENPEEFEPFLIRIDRELLKVIAITEAGWRVDRGVEGTTAAAHNADSVIELFPVAWDRREKSLEQYAAFVKASPFVIPAPPKKYTPRISGVSDKTIKPGEEVRFTVKADGIDPELGHAAFTLHNAAEGMTIDRSSGEFHWAPGADLATGEYTAVVSMTQEQAADVKLESSLKVTIKRPNTEPEITLPESAIVVLGREFVTTAAASDDNPTDTLTFALGSGTPEGLTVDPQTGQIKWTPPNTFTPGRYEVEIKVSDNGVEPKSASTKMTLDVQDDFAELTLLSGIVGKDGVLHAWFRNKATNKVNPLKVGEKLVVSEISADIVTVTERNVTLKDGAGIWKLKLGDSVRQRQLIEPALQQAAEKTHGAEAPAVDTVSPAGS